MSQQYKADFDPNEAFHDVHLSEAELQFIDQRNAGMARKWREEYELEQQKQQEILHRNSEWERRLEERWRNRDEENRRNRAEYERQEAERRLKWEAERLLLPERLPLIIASVKNTGPRWPASQSTRWMDVDALRADLNDSHVDAEDYLTTEMHHDMATMDKLPPVFSVEGIQDSKSSRFFKELCSIFFKVLEEELYPRFKCLGRNVTNESTRRLLTYYQFMIRGAYNYMDLTDAWKSLFHVLLLFEPLHGHYEEFRVGSFLNVMDKAEKAFEETLYKIREENVFKLVRSEGRLPDAVNFLAVVKVLQKTLPENHEFQIYNLYKLLKRRKDQISEWYHEYYHVRETPNMTLMRRLTEEIIEECAGYFVEKLGTDPKVKFLIFVAFGHKSLDFMQTKSEWIKAINALPEECFPSRNSSMLRHDVQNLFLERDAWTRKR
jgi:hypothetical protein